MMEVNRVTYTNWENEKREPTLENVVKLAKILETSTDDLLGYTILSANQPVVALSKLDVANIDKFQWLNWEC